MCLCCAPKRIDLRSGFCASCLCFGGSSNEDVALLSRKTACISKELKEAFGEEISDPHAAFSSLVLAISSEASRGEASGFLPYLELLPPLDTLEHPHFWSEDALKLLEGSNAYEIVERDLQAMSQQYDTSFNPFLAKNPGLVIDRCNFCSLCGSTFMFHYRCYT